MHYKISILLALAATLSACSVGSAASMATAVERAPSAAAKLGRKLFEDQTLSGSGQPAAAEGEVVKFGDLPGLYGGAVVIDIARPGSDAGYLGNVNPAEIPYHRILGGAPALSPVEINDVVSLLGTLTDGYDPVHPTTQVLPAPCQAAAAVT